MEGLSFPEIKKPDWDALDRKVYIYWGHKFLTTELMNINKSFCLKEPRIDRDKLGK